MKRLKKNRFSGSLVVAVAFLCGLLYWQQTASTKAVRTAAAEGRSGIVHVKGLKSAHINFKDGVELSGPSTESSAPVIALAAADFDSDGTPDLVTADRNGQVRFSHGNADSIYPNTPAAKAHLASNGGELSPFQPASNRVLLSFAPDFFVAGDFNADGKSDILATSRGADSLFLLSGNGKGDFAQPTTIKLGGQVTAFTVGEIGRRDGQTDVAVAIQNEKGAQLLVFEHPEGAFKHPPEVFLLPSAATDLAIGQLDGDSYGDIAIAGGNNLTIVHGRGQAYPLDLKADLNIKRPAAFVQTRQFAFDISALAIGRFTASRGDSLALLATDGSIYTLEPGAPSSQSTTNKLTAAALQGTQRLSFAPAQAESELRKFAALKVELPRNEQEADQNGQLMVDSRLSPKDRETFIREKFERSASDFAQLSPSEQNKITAEGVQRTAESDQKRQEGLERALSSRPISLANFRLEAFTSDARLVNAAHSSSTQKLVTARFSDSGKDDLVLVDSIGKRIQVIAQINKDDQSPRTELVSLDSDAAPLAILPMRLNSDALSDLVILREGSAVPTVLETESSLTLVVNTTDNDSGGNCDGTSTCALRRAISIANSNPGLDTITFNIPGAGVHTIHPQSALPDITEAVVIDGTTQPGFAGTPLIEIEGDLLSGANEGLKVRGSNSVIRGLAINHIPSVLDDTGSQIGGSGITVLSTSESPNVTNVIVEGNFLGTDPTGEFKKGNDGNGVHIFDADNNTVGGTTPQARNILSGNGKPSEQKTGVGLAVTGGNNNQIEGNYIGADASGVVKLGNSYGVYFTGKNNQFGGDAAGEGNLVSGNGGPLNQFNQCVGNGIFVDALISIADGSLLTDNNDLKGNLIGTTANGEAPLGNCSTGISSYANINSTIGSITEPGRNVISDNGNDALYCDTAAVYPNQVSGMCTIIGNNIGTDKAGNFAIGNDQRNNGCVGACFITDTVMVGPSDLDFVVVGSPYGTTLGGACTGGCNLISGNYNPNTFGGGGLFRRGTGTVLAVNNYLGTNRAGTAALPNNYGAWSYYGSTIFGAELSDGNGGFIDGGNLASGNSGAGLMVEAINAGGTFEVNGNLVGLSSDGNNPIPNGIGNAGGAGMSITSRPGTEANVGGTDPLQRNFIAATTDDGFAGGNGISLATYGTTRVINNWIGLSKSGAVLANTGSGISATGTGQTFIGGIGANEGNFIIGNSKAGVAVFQFTSNFGTTFTRNVTIRGNHMANNGGLGIDLFNATQSAQEPDGVTPNDCLDADTGANDLQNFPILFAPVFNNNGTVTISGFLGSEPLRDYTIDFYSNIAADPTNYGEGANLIGTTNVTTNGFGSVVFDFTSPGPVSPSEKVITATATNQDGCTSEFSCAAGVCTGGSVTKEQLVTQTDATCPPHNIVVNVTGDEDEDPNSKGTVCNIDPNATPGTERCTLRAAIEEAITRDGRWTIKFNIPGDVVHIISPTTALPTITQSMDIDATTQPGYAVGAPRIEVSGAGAGTGVDGLHVASSAVVTVQGLIINRFSGNGILIDGGSHTITVVGCLIGLTSDGLAGAGNKGDGIKILNSSFNQIGGTDVTRRNIISANGDAAANTGNGITITGTNSTNNSIYGNYIGTDAPGNAGLGNKNAGVYITSNDNTVGKADGAQSAGAHNLSDGGNLISGNVSDGISIIGAASYKVEGNLIGTDHTGSAAIPNRNGIYLKDSAANTTNSSGIVSNLISGNNANGVLIVNSSNATVFDNYIGTTDSTVGALGNDNGVLITDGSHDNLIGGEVGEGDCIFSDFHPNPCHISVISGNRHAGILIEQESGAAPDHNYVTNSWIGTDVKGILRISNETGVSIRNSQHNTVYSNRISGNTTGISISGANGGNNLITDNRIGTEEGIEPLGNTNGVVISSSGNQLAIVERDRIVDGQVGNVISGNTASGVVIRRNGSDPAPTGNTLISNCIGTAPPDCIRRMPNTTGVLISDGAHDNFIGTETVFIDPRTGAENPQNVISGNSGAGIAIEPGPTGQNDAPFHNFVNGNFIGLVIEDSLSLVKQPNQVGVRIQNSQQNVIQENVVSGNITCGIEVGGANGGNNSIISNHVGTNFNDTANTGDLGNGSGILITSSGNLISVNTVFKNSFAGIILQGDGVNPPPSLNSVILNVIGDESEGGTFNPNGIGVLITNGASDNFVGQIGQGNTISGNTAEGVLIQGVPGGTPSGNNVIGNRIGTDVRGLRSVPNLGVSGVRVQDSDHNQIDNNLISGNLNGINILGSLSAQNLVRGNCIGLQADCVSPLGNNENGILIGTAAHHNSIGGPNAGDGNKIAFNKKGVSWDGVAFDKPGCCNMIDPNSIYANTIIGIDLNNSGMPLPNDPGDGDSGPNNLQNYPEFTSALLIPGDKLVITYQVDSAPGNSNYGTDGIYVEIFKADASLQGQTFIASTNYTTTNYTAGLPGPAILTIDNASSFGIQAGDKLVATATDADGNTSEFTSTNVGVVAATPTAADGNIAGQIGDSNGVPIAGVTISLSGTQNRETTTDTGGKYGFDSVETNGFYTLTPSRADYTFTPINRSFSLLGAHTEASFTASANGDRANAIDTTEFFVRQQYLDFLGREPDPPGFIGWVNTIRNCAAGDTSCDRVHVSEAFFRSQEFQERGYFVYRFYSSALGRKPDFAEFTPDLQRVSGFLTNDQLETAKVKFVDDFMTRPAFTSQYNSLSNSAYVEALLNTARVGLSNRQMLIDSLNNGSATRAQILRQIAESAETYQKYYNQAFVVMEYFGYLRRDPDALYLNWIQVLDASPADSRHMVDGFVNSQEYRNRFGP